MLALCALPTFAHSPALRRNTPHNLYFVCTRSPRQRQRGVVWCSNAFEAAIRSGHIRDVGRLVQLCPEGRLSTPLLGAWRSTDAGWDGAVEEAITLLRALLRDALVAVYVRGSVAAGHAFKDGRSDLDLVVLVRLANKKSHAVLRTKHATRACFQTLSNAVLRQFPFVSSVDVSVVKLNFGGPAALPEHVRFLLLAYSAHAFGTDVREELGRSAPSLDALCDIRAREKQALCAHAAGEKRLKYYAWLVKLTLRGLVSLVSPHTKLHARDIVPCTRILAEVYPEHEALVAEAAVLACGAREASEKWCAESLARDLVDFAEHQFLRATFGAAVDDPPRLANSLPVPSVSCPSALERTRDRAARTVANILRRVRPSRLPKEIQFIRDELPTVALHVTKKARTISVSECARGTFLSERLLRTYPAPIVFRGALSEDTVYLRDSRALAEELAQSRHRVPVRVSNYGNEFTFCVSSHPWINEKRFTPPSFVVNITGSEFMQGPASPRRFYMQSEVPQMDKIFEVPSKCNVMQAERRWVSSHGSVSTTHYDSAFSALVVLSGRKRLFFFPPEALPHMGVYPRGHPLHRRAVLDLSRLNAYMFQDFWRDFADQAVEALLGPGDLVVFPPFWAHYTESIAAEGELCVSHTMRYLMREGN